jgi:hypothetical protein
LFTRPVFIKHVELNLNYFKNTFFDGPSPHINIVVKGFWQLAYWDPIFLKKKFTKKCEKKIVNITIEITTN